MQYRILGSTGIRVSKLAFGAGPVSGLMTSDQQGQQRETLGRAIDLGVNWIDTAATYGKGQSEVSLGKTLRELDAVDKVHLATKVRLAEQDLGDIESKIRTSVDESLSRLGVSRITLLQLHNSITSNRGDEPTSVTPEDALGSVLSTFRKLQQNGVVQHIGLTAIGHPASLRQVINSGEFATIQVPYNILNPSAGEHVPKNFEETNYGNVIQDCVAQSMGVFAIRVFAGGALAQQAPSPHTLKTKFFPLDLYQRDQQRAEQLKKLLPSEISLRESAVRYVLSHDNIISAIIGFGEPSHVDDAVAYQRAGPLPAEMINKLHSSDIRTVTSSTKDN